MNIIKVTDLINSSICISSDDGQKLFEEIKRYIEDEKQIVVSFENVTSLVLIFLDMAIGRLYESFDEETIQKLLIVEGLSSFDLDLLNYSIENAKKYYLNKNSYDDAWLEYYEETE